MCTPGMPRFVRVNTLKTTVDEVMEHFSSSGHTLVDSGKWMELEAGTFCHDPHLSDLLVFPTKVSFEALHALTRTQTDFHAEPMYLSGEIILQDKVKLTYTNVLIRYRRVAFRHMRYECRLAPGALMPAPRLETRHHTWLHSFKTKAKSLLLISVLLA